MNGPYKASTLTKDGAISLAGKVNAYWRKLGLSANAHHEKQESEVDGSNAVQVVRSTMINGLPCEEYARRLYALRLGKMFKLNPLPITVIPRPSR
jgi:hypothetical protein